jgi:hypothetical protein
MQYFAVENKIDSDIIIVTFQVTPEILRELRNSRNRGEKEGDVLMSTDILLYDMKVY